MKSSEIGNFIKIYFDSAKVVIISSITLKRKLLLGVGYICNFFKKLQTKFFLVFFHLSQHETIVFSVSDATKKVGTTFVILLIFLIKMCEYYYYIIIILILILILLILLHESSLDACCTSIIRKVSKTKHIIAKKNVLKQF